MKTYRKGIFAATAAFGGLALLTAAATAQVSAGTGHTNGRGSPLVAAPGATMGSGGMMNHGGMTGPGGRTNPASGMMNPGRMTGPGGTMNPGGGLMAPGTTIAPWAPCPGQGGQDSASCGTGNQDGALPPNQQELPSWQ